MTATAHQAHGGHGRTAGHGSRRDYVVGFVLAALLTAIPFWLIMGHVLPSPGATAAAVMLMAAVQVIVHLVYFLHMNSRSEGGWTLLAFLFTVLMVAIVLSGSLWVMHHLDTNMMPPSPQQMREMP